MRDTATLSSTHFADYDYPWNEVDLAQDEEFANHSAAAQNEVRPPKPIYRFTGDLPAPLAHLRDDIRWVAWDYRWKDGRGKWTKPPFNPHNGRLASVSDPTTWGTFDEVVAAMKRYGLAGQRLGAHR